LTSVIVDRRTQKGKSTANRQRLLKRLDGALRAQIGKLVARHKLQDAAHPAEVTIDRKDASEPRLILDPASGSSGRVVPGNDKYRIGDTIANSSSQGQGSGNGQGAGDGDSDEEDTFRFALSRTEYLSLLFDDLELPALVKKDLLEIDENRFRRGGVQRYGNPGSVCVARTFKASIGRRVAAEAQHAEALEEAEAALDAARAAHNTWWTNTMPHVSGHTIAYFSAEFALHQSLPIYAGGLGVLAGDHCKEASDLGVPLIGVGFMYPQGYFHQHISAEGWQEESYERLNWADAPIEPALIR